LGARPVATKESSMTLRVWRAFLEISII
jgi:hypothetical protein